MAEPEAVHVEEAKLSEAATSNIDYSLRAWNIKELNIESTQAQITSFTYAPYEYNNNIASQIASLRVELESLRSELNDILKQMAEINTEAIRHAPKTTDHKMVRRDTTEISSAINATQMEVTSPEIVTDKSIQVKSAELESTTDNPTQTGVAEPVTEATESLHIEPVESEVITDVLVKTVESEHNKEQSRIIKIKELNEELDRITSNGERHNLNYKKLSKAAKDTIASIIHPNDETSFIDTMLMQSNNVTDNAFKAMKEVKLPTGCAISSAIRLGNADSKYTEFGEQLVSSFVYSEMIGESEDPIQKLITQHLKGQITENELRQKIDEVDPTETEKLLGREMYHQQNAVDTPLKTESLEQDMQPSL
ncbi:hypothetical protein EAY46_16000 [Vibrio anguillarum]|uniref:Uncharacterized protein n=2 Tax=Vibrio anguillarum TaxID=55601 RepID=A0ABR9Z8Y4_VIBAN|nr:hypothetical protein [Vibrio anguillarum]